MLEVIISICLGLFVLKIVSPASYSKTKSAVENVIIDGCDVVEASSNALSPLSKTIKKSIYEMDKSIDFDEKEWQTFLKNNKKA